jgi:hypothetical protein
MMDDGRMFDGDPRLSHPASTPGTDRPRTDRPTALQKLQALHNHRKLSNQLLNFASARHLDREVILSP